jgi:hypothetical protein
MRFIVTKVEAIDNYQIYIETNQGHKGIFDLHPYLEIGVYKELKDPHYFNQVKLEYGSVCWPNEQDIAPERLIAELKTSIQ